MTRFFHSSTKTPLTEAFTVVDDVLRQRGTISDLITVHGMINVDFADES